MDKTVFEPRERGPQEREMRTPSEAEFDAVKDERFSPQWRLLDLAVLDRT